MARLEIIMQNPELAACRDELEEMGYSADLGLAGLARPVNFQDAMQPSHAAVLGRNVAAHRVESCLYHQTLYEHDYLQCKLSGC